MGKVLLASLAESDLAETWLYIAEDSPGRADHFIENLGDKFDTLATQPEMGKARHELLPGIRSVSVANYVIFYRPTTSGVRILRVLNGTRDIDSSF